MTAPAPGRVLRLAIAGWGLGELAMGRTGIGLAWLGAEVIGLGLVAAATALLAETTWYLVPYLAGMGFIATWALQAVLAYLRARAAAGEPGQAAGGSQASAAAWLTLPLLAWGTGLWLIAAGAGSPAAVLDRFVDAWPEARTLMEPSLAEAGAGLAAAADDARERLEDLCAAGQLAPDCADAPASLLRDVRIRLVEEDEARAAAVAELVRFERRPSRFLGIFPGTELVPVPFERILDLELAARDADLGARRWVIVNARAGS